MNLRPFVIALLIAFFSFKSFAKGGGTNAVVYAAATQGDVARLKEYFAADTNLLTLRNGLLRTAAMNGQKEAVEFLISQGADVNEKGFFEMAPLAHMAMYGTRSDEKCAEVAIVLIAHGAEVDPVDHYGDTPLQHAVEAKKIKLARVLLAHGADPGRKYDQRYLTPLHFAMRGGDVEMIKLLLEFKPPLDVMDPDGTTPLMRAVSSKNYTITRLLLEHGAKIAPPRSLPGTRRQSEQYWFIQNDNREKTPIFWAMMNGDMKMLALLIEFKAPLNAVDMDGRTPLHYAAEAGNKNLVKMLLEAKASVDIKDDDGATPLFLAETKEHEEVAAMLCQTAAAQGDATTSITEPSREAMRNIARRICAGDTNAFAEFTNIFTAMFAKPNDQAHRNLNWDRLQVATAIIGGEAGKGNDKALHVLKQCLDDKSLKHFALDPLGIAAAAGNQEALDILLHGHEKWGFFVNSVCFALAPAAKANQPLAVDYFVTLALDPQTAKQYYYGVGWLIKEVLETAAAKDNQKAQAALEKFNASYPK
jgi:ankyrin repeat protein